MHQSKSPQASAYVLPDSRLTSSTSVSRSAKHASRSFSIQSMRVCKGVFDQVLNASAAASSACCACAAFAEPTVPTTSPVDGSSTSSGLPRPSTSFPLMYC